MAYGFTTIAAFYLFRGTESILRDFYCSIVTKNRCDLSWESMVESLRTKKKGYPPAHLLDELDNTGKTFMNPRRYPDKCYDFNEILDLFVLCIDVINEMVKLKPND
ncbi:MAG: hypothetical protein JSV09_16970 [Thermoplasmata archaeon]|nr:MAG: hypothetical protein JSV09_16970 [Thermoplasmata archaeon]